jgi:hypothetical protein
MGTIIKRARLHTTVLKTGTVIFYLLIGVVNHWDKGRFRHRAGKSPDEYLIFISSKAHENIRYKNQLLVAHGAN